MDFDAYMICDVPRAVDPAVAGASAGVLTLVCIRDADETGIEGVNCTFAPIRANALVTRAQTLIGVASPTFVGRFAGGFAASIRAGLFGSSSRVGRGRFRSSRLLGRGRINGRFAGGFAASFDCFCFVAHSEKMLTE
jgi:hypothetical protein